MGRDNRSTFDDLKDLGCLGILSGLGDGSINLTGNVEGPLFGTLLLNCKCLECTGLRTSITAVPSRSNLKSQKKWKGARQRGCTCVLCNVSLVVLYNHDGEHHVYFAFLFSTQTLCKVSLQTYAQE